MSVLDIDTNIKKKFTVGDFYTLQVVNLGMSGSLEEEAEKMFKVSFDQIQCELLNTPLKRFERLFFGLDIKDIDNHYIYIDLKDLRTLMLKWFLRKWIKRKYRSGYNKPFCDTYTHDKNFVSTKYINIYNGEVIEGVTGANMMFVFTPK